MKLSDFFSIIKEDGWLSNFLILSSLIIPGYWFIYLRQPQIFENIEAIKLIILAVGYSLPSYLIIYVGVRLSWFGDLTKKVTTKAQEIIDDLEILATQTTNQEEIIQIKNLLQKAYVQADFARELFVITATFSLVTFFANTAGYFFEFVKTDNILGYDDFLFSLYSFQIFASFILVIVSKLKNFLTTYNSK